MLSYEDCLALSELTEAEIAAIARHEHIPAIVAAELGRFLIETPDGCKRIGALIRDEMETAAGSGDLQRVLELKMVLRHFLEEHGPADPPAE
ncbi:MAG: hypothetical protein AB7G39_07950 [Alphaproteobacteria bacterium]